MDLLIVDLDGVIVNNQHRFDMAAKAKETYQQQLKKELGFEIEMRANAEPVKAALAELVTSLYWQAAFNPTLIPTDTLIEGAAEALLALERLEWRPLIISSRPEGTRSATEAWLEHHLSEIQFLDIILKHPAFQRTPTPAWKAAESYFHARRYSANRVLIVDDEQKNLDEMARYLSHIPVLQARSLAEALEVIKREK